MLIFVDMVFREFLVACFWMDDFVPPYWMSIDLVTGV